MSAKTTYPSDEAERRRQVEHARNMSLKRAQDIIRRFEEEAGVESWRTRRHRRDQQKKPKGRK